MPISLNSYPQIDRVSVFLIAFVVCFLPSLTDIGSCREPAPMALPSEDVADREERNPSEPLDGSDVFQIDALIPHLMSSLEPLVPNISSGEDPLAPWASGTSQHRPTPRPPPTLR
jgi:hypothetical protein